MNVIILQVKQVLKILQIVYYSTQKQADNSKQSTETLILSLTIRSNIDNNLNKFKKIEKYCMMKKGYDDKDVKYYT